MKLLIENWRRYLLRENEGKLKEFYHGTTHPMEGFIAGIDQKRAKGYGQGEGFFLYTDKSRAIDHAKSLTSGEMFKGLDGGDKGSGNPIVIVVNPPLTPENFDIDYEGFGNSFLKFIMNNKEYFANNHLKLGMGSNFGLKPDQFLKLANKNKFKFRGAGRRNTVSLNDPEGINPRAAENISITAKLLSELNPEMFRNFEEQVLSKANVLKYNGKEKIIPLRVEDIEGNVIWSR